MKKRLYLTALITSPILAVYGGSPFYIFKTIDFPTFLMLISGLTISTLITWVFHLVYIKVVKNKSLVLHFVVTYFSNLLFRFILFLISPLVDFTEPEFVENYISYPIITSLALNAIIMIILFSVVTSHKKNETERQLQAIKLQNIEAEKQVLMQQLQPHFLFNSLSVLKSLINNDSKLAEEYVLKLSDFLRYSVQSNNRELVSLDKELQFAQDYIDLQKMRYDDAFTHAIEVPTDYLNLQVPILAIQTLVENVFKHNFFTEKNKLNFKIYCESEFLVVSNAKISIRITDRTKTGLQNLNKRYELICGKSIIVEDTEDSFTVKIPLINL